MRKYLLLIFIATSILFSSNINAQEGALGQEEEAITTAVPFLMIAPDSRSGALGDAGAATSPDGYSQVWNSSKLAFVDGSMGLSLTATPWLGKLVDDMYLYYLSGFYRLDKNQTIGASMRYFTMGNINFTDNSGASIGSYTPHEFAIDGSYNRKLTDRFSLGIAGRFIYSNLTGGQAGQEQESVEAGKSAAIDVNGFYTQPMEVNGYKGKWALGFNIMNVGAKLGYTSIEKNFIPTNLKLGGSATIDLDSYNSITATVDFNKLLVPTPPVYYVEGDTLPDGSISDGTIDDDHIKAGKTNNVGIIQGMVQSFNDAPDGSSEELHEISYSFGLEYWYAKQFAVRAGYFHENEYKGNRKYFTAGIGLKLKTLGLDFAYLIPKGNYGNSPLQGTWRFSLIMNFDDFAN